MEVSPPERIYMDPSRDKEYFAAYANLAMHNAYFTLAHINRFCLGIDEKPKEGKMADTEKIEDFSLKEGKMEKTEKTEGFSLFEVMERGTIGGEDVVTVGQLASLERKIGRHFPFLQWMLNDEVQARRVSQEERIGMDKLAPCGKILQRLIKMLTAYRDHYTHALSGKPQFDKGVIHNLRASFDASREMIKQRFGYSTQDVQHLVRFGREKEDGHFGGSKIRLCRPGYHYSFLEEGEALSDKGVYYLICLFLERRDAHLFVKKIYGFKDGRESNHQATFNCYAGYTINPPHDSIVSDLGREALALDIIGELRKCPRELFDLLTKDDQRQFRPSYEQEGGEEVETGQKDGGEAYETFLKRYGNRFPELALRFLDGLALPGGGRYFPNLRFAIHYGRFYYRVDEKRIALETAKRWLTRDLYAFESMDEVAEFREKPEIQALLQKTDTLPENNTAPFIQDREARYAVQSNRLLLSLNPKAPDVAAIVQQKDGQYDRPAGLDMSDSLYISLHDLHAFLFCALNKSGSVLEAWLNQWKNGFLRLLDDIVSEALLPLDRPQIGNGRRWTDGKGGEASGFKAEFDDRRKAVNEKLAAYGLEVSQIPDSIRDYLMRLAPPEWERKAKQILLKMEKEAKQRVEGYEKGIASRKKVRKKGEKIIQSGKIADYLARDMVAMMRHASEGKHSKPNSSQFRELQQCMAKWGGFEHDMPRLFNTLQCFERHPFLKREMLTKGIYAFFKSYFTAKQAYLEGLRKKLGQLSPDDLHFLKFKDKGNIKHIAAQMKNRHPLALPKGFFDQKCREIARKTFKLDVGENDDAVHIISRAYPASQGFYDCPRQYKILDKWLDRRSNEESGESRLAHSLALEERKRLLAEIKTRLDADGGTSETFRRGILDLEADKVRRMRRNCLDTEQRLRWEQAQDRLLFEAARKILEQKTEGWKERNEKGELKQRSSEFEGFGRMDLSRLAPGREGNVFEHRIPYELKYWHKNVEYTIFDHQMKLKDFGKFKRLLHDRRLPGLLAYYPKDARIIQRSDIEKELENYQTQRIRVMKAVLGLEKRMCKEYGAYFEEELSKQIEKDKSDDVLQHNHFLDKLKCENKADDARCHLMKEMRNKFCHSEYPPANLFGGVAKPKGGSIAQQLADEALKLYDLESLGLEK